MQFKVAAQLPGSSGSAFGSDLVEGLSERNLGETLLEALVNVLGMEA